MLTAGSVLAWSILNLETLSSNTSDLPSLPATTTSHRHSARVLLSSFTSRKLLNEKTAHHHSRPVPSSRHYVDSSSYNPPRPRSAEKHHHCSA